MKPHHDRQIIGILGRGDVEVQRILTHATLTKAFQRRVLRGLIAPGNSISYAFPGLSLLRSTPAQLAQRRLGVGDTQKLPGIIGGSKTAQLATGGGHQMALGGGALKVLQRIARHRYSAFTWVGIGKGPSGLKVSNQAGDGCAKVRRTLIKLDSAGDQRHLVADLRTDLDPVVQVAVGVQALQQNQLVEHPLIVCAGSAVYQIKRRQQLATRRAAKHHIADSKGQGFTAAVAELTALAGFRCGSLAALVIKPGYRTIDKGTAQHIIVAAATAAAQTAGQRQGENRQ